MMSRSASWRLIGQVLIASSCLCVLSGCGGEGVEGKASLHEMDHVVAAHWPESVEDLAAKIGERVQKLTAHGGGASDVETAQGDEGAQDKTQLVKELEDLLAWLPEIAADTDMSEADWNGLATSSEDLLKRFRREGLSDGLGAELQGLADQVIQAVPVKEVDEEANHE